MTSSRTAMQLAGVVLVAAGLLLGLGALWVQLARALPLAELLHWPRAVRAMLLAGAGLGLLFLGRGGTVIASLRLPSVEWVPSAREAMQLAGLVLVGTGISFALGALWNQLARALPLVQLLNRPQAAQAMLLAGAGLGLLFLGRTRAGVPQRPRTIDHSPPQRDRSDDDSWLLTG